MELISVIVPVYNAKDFLLSCLDSITKQSYSNLQIIVIDDGSKDGSGEICDQYAKQDDRIVVFHQENKGVSYARNLGISMAEGEYIGFVDADDTIDTDMYSILYRNLIDYAADVSACNVGECSNKKCYEKKVKLLNRRELLEEIFLHDNIKGYLHNKLFKRKVCKRAKLQESINICEDLYYLCEIIDEGIKIVYDTRELYYMQVNNLSLTRTLDNLFDSSGRLKYVEVLNNIANQFYMDDPEIKDMIYLHEGRLVIGVLQEVYEKSNTNLERVQYLREIFRERKELVLKSKDISITRKLSIVLTYYFPSVKSALKKLLANI